MIFLMPGCNAPCAEATVVSYIPLIMVNIWSPFIPHQIAIYQHFKHYFSLFITVPLIKSFALFRLFMFKSYPNLVYGWMTTKYIVVHWLWLLIYMICNFSKAQRFILKYGSNSVMPTHWHNCACSLTVCSIFVVYLSQFYQSFRRCTCNWIPFST